MNPDPSAKPGISMRIGELAARAECQVETVRYYERQGLLPQPARSSANYRLYQAVHLERLTFIRYCRSLGMSLDEVRVLLEFRDAPDKDCGEVNALLDRHIGHVAARIVELQGLAAQLEKLRGLCRQADAAGECGILNELSLEANAASETGLRRQEAGAEQSHVPGAHGSRGDKGGRR
jgi:Cd(II)/Pb(II)-responsive transcriptional regulator